MALNTPFSPSPHRQTHRCLRLNLECIQPAGAAAAADESGSDSDSEVEAMEEQEEMEMDEDGVKEEGEEEEEEQEQEQQQPTEAAGGLEEYPHTALDDIVQATTGAALLQPAFGVVRALAQQGLLLREAAVHQL
jgi:hypothetical protein